VARRKKAAAPQQGIDGDRALDWCRPMCNWLCPRCTTI